jgi:hypothetical protein
VLTLMQDRCAICVKCTIGSKIILDAPDGTLRCVGHVESHFGPFGDKCRCHIGARFAPNVPSSQKLFWTHPIVLLGDKARAEACLIPFGDSANLDARWVRGLCQT